jgi:hypothetical protein
MMPQKNLSTGEIKKINATLNKKRQSAGSKKALDVINIVSTCCIYLVQKDNNGSKTQTEEKQNILSTIIKNEQKDNYKLVILKF